MSPVGNFEEVTALFVGIYLKNTQKSMKIQQSTLFDNLIPILFRPRTLLKNRTSDDLSVDTMRYSKRNSGEVDEVQFRVYNESVKVSELSLFLTT